MSEMFNRYAIGVRTHANGVGVKQANVSSKTVQILSSFCAKAGLLDFRNRA